LIRKKNLTVYFFSEPKPGGALFWKQKNFGRIFFLAEGKNPAGALSAQKKNWAVHFLRSKNSDCAPSARKKILTVYLLHKRYRMLHLLRNQKSRQCTIRKEKFGMVRLLRQIYLTVHLCATMQGSQCNFRGE